MPKKAEPELRYLGDLARLDIRPGDRFVLMVPFTLSEAQASLLRQQWARFVGEDSESAKCIVLDQGCKLGVVNFHGHSDADDDADIELLQRNMAKSRRSRR